jgi:hypothetical protein
MLILQILVFCYTPTHGVLLQRHTEGNTRLFETLQLLNLEQNNSRMNSHFDITHPLKCGHALIFLVRVSNLIAESLRTNFRLLKGHELKRTGNKYVQ